VNKSLSEAVNKAARSIMNVFPYFIGIILLMSIVNVSIPKSFYWHIFTKNPVLDPLIGAVIGSLSVGNPIISYIISGELLKQGVSLTAVTAFVLSWVTVGIIQLPAECAILGKKFAIYRNILSFLFAVVIAMIIGVVLA
jgi:uncharacterized membrane protein YraQ (UPF0718 family)